MYYNILLRASMENKLVKDVDKNTMNLSMVCLDLSIVT